MKLPNQRLRILVFFSLSLFIFSSCKRVEPKKFNRNIPEEANTEMQRLLQYQIAVFAFTPSNGWVIVTKDGRYFARNIPEECFQKLEEFVNAGHKIQHIAFPPRGGNSWVIITDRTKFARNIPEECNTKLNEYYADGKRVRCVAFPPNRGDNSWVIVTNDGFFARNIPDECYQIMLNLYQRPQIGANVPRLVHYVSFTPTGGWLVLARDYYFARNIPQECFQQMGVFNGESREMAIVAFSPQRGGWSIISNLKFNNRPTDEIRVAERSFPGGKDIWDRMRDYNTPGVSIAVVLNNQLAWSCGYGHMEKDIDDAIHPKSVFQAASISKVLAAIGAYKWTENGLIGFDERIRPRLSLNIPTRACLTYTDSVTIRGILRHRSGISGRGTTRPLANCTGFCTNCNNCACGGGFAGYLNSGNTVVPNLTELFNGTSTRPNVTVNSPRIDLSYTDGRFSYSGSAYTVLQQLALDITNRPFEQWMRANVLNPMRMDRSAFAINPSQQFFDERLVATGHDNNGNPINGKRRLHPEFAAAGLYTTCEDLANVIIMLNNGGTINGNTVLTNGSVTNLITNGIGIFTGNGNITANGNFYTHGGSNTGFRCVLFGFPASNAGVVVMTNGQNGGTAFREEIAQAVIQTYGW